MDVKIIRQQDCKMLVVTDDEVNNSYQFSSKDKPIVLGGLVHFFSSGFYALLDYRRKEFLLPSPYLEEGVEEILVKSPEHREQIISELHSYKTYTKDDKEIISWPRYNSYCYEGDLNKEDSYNPIACFSYGEAYKRLKEQRDFWLSYDSKDLTADCIRIANPKRQPTSSQISFKQILKQLEEEKQQQNSKLKI